MTIADKLREQAAELMALALELEGYDNEIKRKPELKVVR